MKILITGGAGYIGSALIPLILDNKNSEISILDKLVYNSQSLFGLFDKLKIFRNDIVGDLPKNIFEDVDVIIHLAAKVEADKSIENEKETLNINYEGTKKIFNLGLKHSNLKHFIFASSTHVYGRNSEIALTEDIKTNSINPYSESKILSEEYLNKVSNENGINVSNLRIATNYGYSSGIRFNLMVNKFVLDSIIGNPLTIYGDGTNWRPFIHVQDTARAIKHIFDNKLYGTYNIGSSDQNYKIKDVFNLINNNLEKNIEVEYLRDKNPGPNYNISFDKFEKTGFEVNYNLEKGIKEMIDKLNG